MRRTSNQSVSNIKSMLFDNNFDCLTVQNHGFNDETYYSTPSYSTPSYSTPSYSTPSYTTPSYTTPSYSTPSYNATPSYTANKSYNNSYYMR